MEELGKDRPKQLPKAQADGLDFKVLPSRRRSKYSIFKDSPEKPVATLNQ